MGSEGGGGLEIWAGTELSALQMRGLAKVIDTFEEVNSEWSGWRGRGAGVLLERDDGTRVVIIAWRRR